MAKNEVRERLLMDGPAALSDADLLTVCGAEVVASVAVRQLAWVSVAELRRLGLGEARAVALAAAFELGRRGAWAPPERGQRCLDPQSVYELMRPVAHAPVEEFHVVMLDVRGRLLRAERIAQGALTQCPVNPRDVFRTAVREAAHGIVFVHNHPSGVMSRPRLRGVHRRRHALVRWSGLGSLRITRRVQRGVRAATYARAPWETNGRGRRSSSGRD